jgi:hypothetical protein
MTPISLTVTDLTAEDLATLARMFGGGTGAPAGSTGTTTATGGTTSGGTAPGGATPSPAPPPAAIDWFPSVRGLAHVPSPENSMIRMVDGKPFLTMNGTPVDKADPYIVDSNGTIVTIDTTPNPSGYYPILGNGKPETFNHAEGDAALIAQGKMWYRGSDGRWDFLSGTGGGAGNLTTLPTFNPAPGVPFGSKATGTAGSSGAGSTSTTGSGPATEPYPAAPAPVSPAPGSTANIIKVGPSQTIKTMVEAVAAAQPGDTIVADPTAVFNESFAIDKPLRLVGGGTTTNGGKADATWSGGAKIDVSKITALAHQLGAVVPMIDCIIEGFEIMGAGVQEPGHGGTAGIRNGGPGNFTIRHNYIHDNQNGGFSGFPSKWTVEDNIFVGNGDGDGGAHNFYCSEADLLTWTRNTSIQNPVTASPLRTMTGQMNLGHALKSRAKHTIIAQSYGYAADETPYDFPDGGKVEIIGGIIEKKAGDLNHGFLGYSMESANNGLAGVKAGGGLQMILNCDNPLYQSQFGGPADFDSTVKWSGNKPVAEGGNVTGLPI